MNRRGFHKKKKMCKKTKFRSQEASDQFAARLKKTSKKPIPELSSYLCTDCNCWHLTKQKPRKEFMPQIDRQKLHIQKLNEKIKTYKAIIKNLNIKIHEERKKNYWDNVTKSSHPLQS